MTGAASDLAPLLDTIADEARRKADEILDTARDRAEAMDQKAALQARARESEAEVRGRAEGDEEARRQLALARLEARRALLHERDAQVERVLEEARRRLTALAEGPEAAHFLADLVAGAARALDERRLRVRVRAQDRGLLAAAESVPDVVILFDDAALDEPGAVISTLDGRRRADLTLAAILRRRREAARRAAAAVLFAEEPAP